MKIVCIGDSNTYGYDPRGWMGSRYPKDVRWVDRIQGLDVVNDGHNGACIPTEREYARYVRMLRDGVDAVVVMLGTNDILQGHSLPGIAERMDAFVDMLRKHAKVLVIAPVALQEGTWVDSSGMIEDAKALADEYRKIAQKKGCFFGDANEWGVELMFDGVHFSKQGHDAFYRGILKCLEGLRDA